MSKRGEKAVFREVPILHPTKEEWAMGLAAYVEKIHELGENAGLVKIIPPDDWNGAVAKDWDNDQRLNFKIDSPIMQYVDGAKGIFQATNVVQKPLLVKHFHKKAENAQPAGFDPEKDDEVEERFWQSVKWNPPIYGADHLGSIFGEEVAEWNLNKLSSVLDFLEGSVAGVTTAYLYFGMWKAFFAWHTEDMDLPSVNYLHFGAPKKWYGIPAYHCNRFKRFAEALFPDLYHECPDFLRHKLTMIHPSLVIKEGIHVCTAVQRPGEFMITFPSCFHAGFNHGFNCAEATNFAFPSWFPVGLKATWCHCRADSVRIDVERLQARYQAFQDGKLDEWDAEHALEDIDNSGHTGGRMMATVVGDYDDDELFVFGDGASANNDHLCHKCRDVGELLLCDGCPNAFHLECADLDELPEDDWFCPRCVGRGNNNCAGDTDVSEEYSPGEDVEDEPMNLTDYNSPKKRIRHFSSARALNNKRQKIQNRLLVKPKTQSLATLRLPLGGQDTGSGARSSPSSGSTLRISSPSALSGLIPTTDKKMHSFKGPTPTDCNIVRPHLMTTFKSSEGTTKSLHPQRRARAPSKIPNPNTPQGRYLYYGRHLYPPVAGPMSTTKHLPPKLMSDSSEKTRPTPLAGGKRPPTGVRPHLVTHSPARKPAATYPYNRHLAPPQSISGKAKFQPPQSLSRLKPVARSKPTSLHSTGDLHQPPNPSILIPRKPSSLSTVRPSASSLSISSNTRESSQNAPSATPSIQCVDFLVDDMLEQKPRDAALSTSASSGVAQKTN